MIRIALISLLSCALATAGVTPLSETEVARAKELKEYIAREKPDYERREQVRQDALEELDRLNSDQNRVRQRIGELGTSQQELNMALDNLAMEFQKQREMESQEKKRLLLMLKIVYKLHKEGVLRFVVRGSNLAELGSRMRVLYRTLRAHTVMTQHLQERAQRLTQSESKLGVAKQQAAHLLVELQEQEGLLSELLDQKQRILRGLTRKQSSYQTALREFKQISQSLNSLFDTLEPPRGIPALPHRRTLPAPLEAGKLVKSFGKSVHQKFGTVTFQKGLEIAAAQNAPVRAVLDGTIEFEGWVKGLGNVLIIHHGGGLYSLNAHLFRSLAGRGTKVKQGDTVALVGDTGNSERPSLYFELRENGKALDPIPYFSQKAIASLK